MESSRAPATALMVERLPLFAPAWLVEQRWYGGKATGIAEVEVEDVLWLPAAGIETALVILAVHRHDAGRRIRDRYVLLARAGSSTAGLPIGEGHGRELREVSAEPDALGALIAVMAAGGPVAGVRGGALTVLDGTADLAHLATAGSPSLPIALLGREQSNTSVRVGTTHIFKMLRRLEEGEHPQIEIGRFLSRIGFRHAPPLMGSLVYIPRDGLPCAIGVLEGWIDSVGDGWSYTVKALAHAVSDADAFLRLTGDMAVLGATTAGFHQAMASDTRSPAFAPEPITRADRLMWRERLLEQFKRVETIIEHPGAGWPAAATDAAARLRRSLGGASLAPLASDSLRGECNKIRIHGDLHLGQTLRTADGFALIDFEGEPSKPIAVRRQKQSPLRDVAGMLRSFDYAVMTALPAAAVPTARSMRDGLRRAFLDGYVSHMSQGSNSALPPGENLAGWLRTFELEKALYEVDYEANNRPSWIHIPLAAVAEMLASPTGHDGAP